MAEAIGAGKCPLCGSHKARFSLSKKGLACCVCNSCNMQLFARSERSDEILRSNIAKEQKQAEKQEEPAEAAIKNVADTAPEKAASPRKKTLSDWLS